MGTAQISQDEREERRGQETTEVLVCTDLVHLQGAPLRKAFGVRQYRVISAHTFGVNWAYSVLYCNDVLSQQEEHLS